MNLRDFKQQQEDLAKVLLWAKQIGETDPALIDELVMVCKNDPEVMAFFAGKAMVEVNA